MKNFLKAFVADESGASAAEYALILAVIGVAIGGAAFALGDQVKVAITGAAQDVKDCNDASDTTCPAATLT